MTAISIVAKMREAIKQIILAVLSRAAACRLIRDDMSIGEN